MERCKKIARGAAAGLLSAAVLMSSMLTTSFGQMRASAAEVRNPQATLTVDLDPAVNTGDIVHGAAGFLYGVSSEDFPGERRRAGSDVQQQLLRRIRRYRHN